MAVSIAAFFDSHHLADAEIRFVGDGDGGAAGTQLLGAMPGHQLVLRNASERWAAELERWQLAHHQGGRQPGAGGGGGARAAAGGRLLGSPGGGGGRSVDGGGGGEAAKPVVTIGLAGGHELGLGRALVELLYTGKLPADVAGDEGALLRLLEVAHCCMLHEAVKAVVRALAALVEARPRLAWGTVEALLAAPEDIAAADGFAALRQQAHAAVFGRFGDLELALADATETAALQRLPAAALAKLLARGRLRVASECSVVAAVAAWVHARGGVHNVSQQDCLWFLRCVRISRLPLSYAVSGLLQHSWVCKTGVDHLVSTFVALMALPQALGPARDLALAAAPPELRRWYPFWRDPPARAASSLPQLALRLPAVSEEQLQAMFEAAQRQTAGEGGAAAAAAAGAGRRRRGGENSGSDGGSAMKRRKGANGGTSRAMQRQPLRPQQDAGLQRSEAQAGDAHEQSASGQAPAAAAATGCCLYEITATTVWSGLRWRARLRWAPVPGGAPGGPLQLQLRLAATHPWCKRGAAVQACGVSATVESYKHKPLQGAARVRAGAAEGRPRVAVTAAAPAASETACGAELLCSQASTGAADAGAVAAATAAAARQPHVHTLRQPQALWAEAAEAAAGEPSGGEPAAAASPGAEAPLAATEAAGAREVAFDQLVPVPVSEWVYDWEGVSGPPLGLAAYMQGRGGTLRLLVGVEGLM